MSAVHIMDFFHYMYRRRFRVGVCLHLATSTFHYVFTSFHFEFQYYNNLAVYYSLKGDFEHSLAVYDSAFHVYQQQAMQILEEQIARVNGEYDKKLYDQQIQLQRYNTTLLVFVFILLSILGVMLIVWLVRILLLYRQKNMQLKADKAKLDELNVELVDTTNKQTRKLYAVSDICKNTYASVVLANPEMIKVISRSLRDNLSDEYPQLSNMDYTYMFLDFIGLSVKDICQILNVQEGTYYCRRSAIKKKISSDTEQDIDELFNQFFLGKLVLVQQTLVGKGNFYRVKVFALDVFYQRHFHHGFVRYAFYVSRNFG